MKRIHDVMRAPVETIASHELLPAAARTLCEHDLRLLVVISDEGHAIGTLTDRDIVRVVGAGQDAARERVGDVCTSEVITISPDDSVEVAASLMGQHGIRRLPVCRDGELVGIVALDDLAPDHLQTEGILRAIAAEGGRGRSRRIGGHRPHVREYLHRLAG